MNKVIKHVFIAAFSFCSIEAFAVDCSSLSVWSSIQAYSGGAEVQHNNVAYRANWWTQNQNPEQYSGQWQEWTNLGACNGGGSNLNPIAQINGPYQAVLGDAISFSSQGSNDPDGNIVSYAWSFGDNGTSNQQNPIYTYSAIGAYTVSLTVTDNQGATSVATTTATISSAGNGNDCSGVAQYVVGNSYAVGDIVANNNNKYQCKIAGWCSSNAAWAYAPGTGSHWQSAWLDAGACDTGPMAPIANANGPYSGNANVPINFSSAGSNDPDGTIVTYEWDFGDGASSNQVNPSHSYSANGNYVASLTVTDNDGMTDSSSAGVTISDATPPDPLPKRLLIGYWHNFDNGSTTIKIKDVDSAWDFINVSFAENKPGGAEGEVAFSPFNDTDADFIAGIKAQQAKGKKVLISLGGANAHLQLKTITARDNYVRTMGEIIAKYGFDGLDIDLEGGSLSMDAGDTITNVQTPAIVNLIDATRTLKQRFGSDFILTMAPETAYVQGGLNNFGGIWGAYLPLIHALRDDLTVLHVQHYNTGSMYGNDGNIYNAATVDFHVALIDMLITGFNAASPSNPFVGLKASQVAIGLPSGTSSASSGYTVPADVHKAMDCLIKKSQCGSYVPAQAHPNLRGLMTWSINWDEANGKNFSTPHRSYLDQNP